MCVILQFVMTICSSLYSYVTIVFLNIHFLYSKRLIRAKKIDYLLFIIIIILH